MQQPRLVLVTVALQLVTSLVRAQQQQEASVPRVVGEQGGVISLECVRYLALSLLSTVFSSLIKSCPHTEYKL